MPNPDEAGTLSNSELFDRLLNALREESKGIKNSIKEDIKIENKKILDKLDNHSAQIINLESKCARLAISHCQLERQLRKNNILIFGLNVPDKNNILSFVLGKLKHLLGIDILETDINNIYQLKSGNDKIAPIKVEFLRYIKKELVKRNLNKLKGSNIYIRDDLCKEDQAVQKILVKHLKAARSKNLNAKIKGSVLIINGEAHTVNDLERDFTEINCESGTELDYIELPKSNSAPQTPTQLLQAVDTNVSNSDASNTPSRPIIDIKSSLLPKNTKLKSAVSSTGKENKGTKKKEEEDKGRLLRSNSYSSDKQT